MSVTSFLKNIISTSAQPSPTQQPGEPWYVTQGISAEEARRRGRNAGTGAVIPQAPTPTIPTRTTSVTQPQTNFQQSPVPQSVTPTKKYSVQEMSDAINGLGSMVYGGRIASPIGSTQDIAATQDALAKQRAERSGLYGYDSQYHLSPDQLSQVDNSAESVLQDRLGASVSAYANEQVKSKGMAVNSDTGLTQGQSSLFNSIASEYFKSPLVAANDRTVVLKGVVDKIKSSPEMAANAAMQRNLVYSYIQALDTYQSAVREGEIDGVTALDSRVGSLLNEVTRINQGQTVRPEVALQIADAAKMLVDTINTGAKSKQAQFRARASAIGLGSTWDNFTGQGGGIDGNEQSGGDYQFIDGRWQ